MRALTALAIAGALSLLLLGPEASAHWKPEYANAPPEWQQWYATRQLTEETRARLGVGWKSCCNHSDVVKTQFKVNRKDAGDEWFYWNEAKPGSDKWDRLPPDIVHQGDFAPDNQPTLFVYSDFGSNFPVPNGTPLCFFPGPGGI